MRAIDLFAGAGGWSTGAVQAGANVIWAADHWPPAVATHQENHPGAIHVCQDLQQADWPAVPDHDLMLASPSCAGHTKARGEDKPHHDEARSTAWAVVSAAEYCRPPVVLVENVVEFASWVLYPAWTAAMHALGYALRPYIADAADHGVPQSRVRLYIVCTQSKHPLEIDLPVRRHRTAREFVDYASGRGSPVSAKVEKTRARVLAGRQQYGDRFLLAYYGNGGPRTLDRPLGTLTTHDRWGVVDGDQMRMLSIQEAKAAMGFPADYRLPRNGQNAMKMLGNAVVPVVAQDFVSAVMEAA